MAKIGYSQDGYGTEYDGCNVVDLTAFEVNLPTSLVKFGVDTDYCYIDLNPDAVGSRFVNSVPATTVSSETIRIDFTASGIMFYRNGVLILTI